MIFDQSGNLYGVTSSGGTGNGGTAFQLTPSGGGWTLTDLYDFTGGLDGGSPFGSVLLDANGKLYGTAWQGGRYGYDVIWELTR